MSQVCQKVHAAVLKRAAPALATAPLLAPVASDTLPRSLHSRVLPATAGLPGAVVRAASEAQQPGHILAPAFAAKESSHSFSTQVCVLRLYTHSPAATEWALDMPPPVHSATRSGNYLLHFLVLQPDLRMRVVPPIPAHRSGPHPPESGSDFVHPWVAAVEAAFAEAVPWLQAQLSASSAPGSGTFDEEGRLSPPSLVPSPPASVATPSSLSEGLHLSGPPRQVRGEHQGAGQPRRQDEPPTLSGAHVQTCTWPDAGPPPPARCVTLSEASLTVEVQTPDGAFSVLFVGRREAESEGSPSFVFFALDEGAVQDTAAVARHVKAA